MRPVVTLKSEVTVEQVKPIEGVTTTWTDNYSNPARDSGTLDETKAIGYTAQ